MTRPGSNIVPDADLCRDVLESCIDGVISLDDNGCCIFINDVATRILGVCLDEVIGRPIRDALADPWAEVLSIMFAKARETDEIVLMEVTGTQPDTWFECRARRHAMAVSCFLWDISERRLIERALRDSEARLAHDAFHDSLTGLPNRTLFMDRLAHAFSVRRRRVDFQFAVLFMDLDRFKTVNDSLGHGIGDDLLCAVSERIKRCIRAMDMVARVGGDEFVVLLEELRDESGAIHVADRIIRELALPIELQGHEVFTSTSVGIGLSSSNYVGAEEILRDADTAMYRAKADGGNRYLVADVQMHRQILERLELEAALRRAVARNELNVEYQPIVSVQEGRLTGFEALVRWNRDGFGPVSPARFLPIAEEIGLAVPIGLRVLSQACAEAVRWRSIGPETAGLHVSVNLSARQFTSGSFPDDVRAALKDAGLEPSGLRLEITEALLLVENQELRRQLAEIKAMGVHLQMDDFGTGYSSLSHLHTFPMNGLKIDGSFVGQLSEGCRSEVVRTILGLARDLGIYVVAEGVENEDQLAILRNLGCEFAQGYLFSRPVTARKAIEMVADILRGEHPGFKRN